MYQWLLLEVEAPRFSDFFCGGFIWFALGFSPRNCGCVWIVPVSSSDELWTTFHCNPGSFNPDTCSQQTCYKPYKCFCADKFWYRYWEHKLKFWLWKLLAKFGHVEQVLQCVWQAVEGHKHRFRRRSWASCKYSVEVMLTYCTLFPW